MNISGSAHSTRVHVQRTVVVHVLSYDSYFRKYLRTCTINMKIRRYVVVVKVRLLCSVSNLQLYEDRIPSYT